MLRIGEKRRLTENFPPNSTYYTERVGLWLVRGPVSNGGAHACAFIIHIPGKVSRQEEVFEEFYQCPNYQRVVSNTSSKSLQLACGHVYPGYPCTTKIGW